MVSRKLRSILQNYDARSLFAGVSAYLTRTKEKYRVLDSDVSPYACVVSIG